MTAQLRGDAAEAAVEDFLWLLGVGEHVDRALPRVGMSAAAMEKRLTRLGVAVPDELVGADAKRRRRRARHG